MEKPDIFSAGKHLKQCLSVAVHDPFFIQKVKNKVQHTRTKKSICSILAGGYQIDEKKRLTYYDVPCF